MKTRSIDLKNNKGKSGNSLHNENQNRKYSGISIKDNRSETTAQMKLQKIANKSTTVINTVQFNGFGMGNEVLNPVMVQTGLPQAQNILIHPDYNRALPTITGAFAKLNNDHRHIELAMKIQLLQSVLNNPDVTQEEFGNVRHAVSGLLANLRSEHHIAEQEYEIARKERLKNQGN